MRKANTLRWREWLRETRNLELNDYEALRLWAISDLSEFWKAIWDYFQVQSPTPITRVLDSTSMPGARWFEGAQVNYAAQVLRNADAEGAASVPAVVYRNERLHREGCTDEIAWTQMREQVGALAAWLRAQGIGRGDRVAAYLPNAPHAIIAFLACASIGAIWSMCAPDMGAATVRDRFQQITPKLLIACDGNVYGGKGVHRIDVVTALLQDLPTVRTLLLVPYLEAAGGPPAAFDLGAWPGHTIYWSQALETADRVSPEPVPFEHPLWIVYSSGTTGLPKPIVHGHGGVMLEMLKLHRFHLDLQPSMQSDERFLWYSSSGWVMWNLAVSALLQGTTVCIYDGHPSLPEPDTLWRFAEDVKATFFGAGAAYYTACMKAGISPGTVVDSQRLRALGSTGSPLPPEAYVWGQEQLGPDMWWAVVSGGTDLASAFLGGTPELPTVPGEMQARCLGADVHAWDEQARTLVDEVGELVCVQPMPSMPLFFWGDSDGRRLRESYFDTYPGVWRHGDWLRITQGGGAIVYGRSDATLNRHGHRLGTSELYRVVEAVPDVIDSLVVDIEFLGRASHMPLFVVLRPGLSLSDELRQELKRRIRESLSPRFIPDSIEQVAEIPRTLTGKKQELPVKKLMLGKPLDEVVNRDACANPSAFDWYVQYAARMRG